MNEEFDKLEFTEISVGGEGSSSGAGCLYVTGVNIQPVSLYYTTNSNRLDTLKKFHHLLFQQLPHFEFTHNVSDPASGTATWNVLNRQTMWADSFQYAFVPEDLDETEIKEKNRIRNLNQMRKMRALFKLQEKITDSKT
jgi:hypothetical protein